MWLMKKIGITQSMWKIQLRRIFLTSTKFSLKIWTEKMYNGTSVFKEEKFTHKFNPIITVLQVIWSHIIPQCDHPKRVELHLPPRTILSRIFSCGKLFTKKSYGNYTNHALSAGTFKGNPWSLKCFGCSVSLLSFFSW